MRHHRVRASRPSIASELARNERLAPETSKLIDRLFAAEHILHDTRLQQIGIELAAYWNRAEEAPAELRERVELVLAEGRGALDRRAAGEVV